MGLRIIAADEPIRVETIVVTIYGPPGVGKTSLASSAHSSLLLDTDGGVYRSAFRKDSVAAPSWNAIAGISAADLKPYNTVVLDTTGRGLDLLSADIIAGNPKMGRGGALTLQGYGELKSRFAAYLSLLRSFGLDVVLIAHSDEKQQGDEIVERIDMQGGSKQEVYKLSDSMARLGVVNGKRVLTFSPTETRFGKDPANIGAVDVPSLTEEPSFLGDLIDRIKQSLNAESASQQKAAAKATAWIDRCQRTDTPEGFTALIAEAGEDRRAKAMLLSTATAKGFTFDKAAGVFISTAEPALL